MSPTTAATALSAVSVIPFHCIICFEEFDLRHRSPVVLPCGHTFVCSPCAKRLRRCMECREPLSFTPATRVSHVATGRNQRHAPPETPRKPVDPIPLPIPRNLLMITLLEAAERQEQLFGEALFVDESMETSMLSTEADIATSASHEEDEEMEGILLGIEAMTGPCGTYLVKDPEGLDVLPFDPRRHKRQEHDSGKNPPVEDVLSPPTAPQEPFTVNHRQTVQVVGFSDGVFKLARSAGYIVANEHQLVKVGTPLEKSCQLEGMKHLVDLRKQDLQQQLDELQNKLERIMRLSDGLQIRTKEVLDMDPDHPVIAEAPDVEDCCYKSSAQGDTTVVSPELFDSPMAVRSPGRDVIVSATSSHEVEVTESPIPHHYTLRTPNTIDNSELDREYVDDTHRYNAILPLELVGCGSGLFGPTHVETSGSFDSIIDTPAVRPRLSPPMIPSSMSPTSIDFSTGMSGHRGLAKTRTGTHSLPTRQVRMMGAHRGLGSSVRPRRLPHPNSISSNFPLSSMFTRPPQNGSGGQHQQNHPAERPR